MSHSVGVDVRWCVRFVACLVGGVLFAEFYGYWLHRLLHSDRIHWLSRNHMIHHLKIYGPRMKQRPASAYRYAVDGRAHVGGIGMEWLVPIGLTSAIIVGAFLLVGGTAAQAGVFLGGALGYSYFLFWLLHNAMHQRETRLLRWRWVAGWFLKARRRHDIHHVRLSSEGVLNSNFGIGFGGLDWVFGTAHSQASPVQDPALERAHERYREVMGLTGHNAS